MTDIPLISSQIAAPNLPQKELAPRPPVDPAVGVDKFISQAGESRLLEPPSRDLCHVSDNDQTVKTKEQVAPPSIELLPVPFCRQCTTYSCGASALQAVLMYYGEEYIETDLMEMLGTKPEGTAPKDMARVAKELGFESAVRENLTIEDLSEYMKQKTPVIISAQAWREGEDKEKPWSELWNDGHYMVVVGVDEKNVYFEDPSLLGSIGVIPREEFMERWHDQDEKKYYQMGIIIKGKTPKPPPPFMAVLSEAPDITQFQ